MELFSKYRLHSSVFQYYYDVESDLDKFLNNPKGGSVVFDYEKIIKDMLVEVTGIKDVGLLDPLYKEVSTTIPPKYAEWLSKNDDVSIMQPDDGAGAFSSIGPGKFAVQQLIFLSLGIVGKLIEAGVPESVAFELLPQDIYKRLPMK